MNDELREEQRKATSQAIRRQYQRAVDEKAFPDSKDSWKAFVHGWCGTSDYDREYREANQAGSGWFLIMMMSFMIGALVVFCAVISLYHAPPWLDHVRTYGVAFLGLGLLVLGEWARRMHNKAASRAGDEFAAKWRTNGESK